MTTAADLVTAIESRGIRLRERDGGIAARPAKAVTSTEREALAILREEVLAYLRGRTLGADWTKLSLYQLNCVLEVSVPWADASIILAPGCRIARELRATDTKPGRIWCSCEVIDLLLTGVGPADAQRIAQTKLTTNAAVVGAWKCRR